MADLGRFSLLAAFVLALYAVAAAALGGRARRPEIVQSAVRALWVVAALEVVAAGVLALALARRDYTFAYVISHVSNAQALVYDLTSFWGGMEGSLLLWALILSAYTALAVRAVASDHPRLLPGVTGVCAGVAVFFLFMLTSVTSPFVTTPFPPADGRGMNPLLLNPWMAIHPPTLYLGFVGLTVPFAIVIASLLDGAADEGGVLLARRWMMWAWYCLSMGLMFGAKWSYVVLGWGGYWAWDPVENAALMPWLVATAFLHSVMIQERRGMLKQWTVLLVVLAFGLSIFGTFLTRSGVLSSIHSFTQSPLGTYFLAFLAAVMLAAFGLVAWRWEALRSENTLDSALSRESVFLLNNAVFLATAFTVFLGTVFPVVSEVLSGRKINVGPPFFAHVVTPLALVLLLLMGVGPLIAWRRASAANLRQSFLTPGAVGVVLGLGLLAAGMRAPGAVLAFTLCGFVAGTIGLEFARGIRVRRAHQGEGPARALVGLVLQHRRRYGGYTVHLGILLLFAGLTGSSVFSTQRLVTLHPGEAVQVGEYRVRFDGLRQSTRHGALVITAGLQAFSGGRNLGTLEARRNLFLTGEDSTTAVALRSTLRDDLYVTLIGWTDTGEATLRLLVNPLVAWMWIGGLVISAGSAIAMLPERRSVKVVQPVLSGAWSPGDL
ncbi:MAG TPA: cytochrome c-type biogenesis CcmF C-terminal domain-containing protein [bacterium]|nr:cytochrome c-type biogenesis CcmF C-terminal domain-containing protein [bacterium]